MNLSQLVRQLMPARVKDSLRAEAKKSLQPPMTFPTYSPDVVQYFEEFRDDVRYATLALAIQRLETERIDGAFAELGVHQGATSRVMHKQAPHRRLYLFDTFAGFPAAALEVDQDERFKDTSEERVAAFIGDQENVIFRAGYFPETAAGLEGERFALVMLDFDLYKSAVDAFNFFYPRLVPGAYFFMHDFNNPESDHAISRAAHEFLADKPERLMEIPDVWGTAMFRKV